MIYKNKIFSLENIEIKNKNFSTPKYHWNSLNKKKRDIKYLNKIYDKFLYYLSSKLNKVHKTNFSKDYWRIVIGPWLNIYIASTYDRYFILKEFIYKKKKILNYNSQSIDIFENNNYFEYINKIHNSEKYNYKIFDKLIKFFFIKNVRLIQSQKKYNEKKKFKISIFKHEIISLFKKYLFILFSYFKKNIFLTTFFKKKSLLKIKKIVGSNCNLYFFFNFYNCFINKKYDLEFREKLSLDFNSKNKFEKFLKLNLFKELPKSYLESFMEIKKSAEKTNQCKQKIITTVEYIMDDFYKIWLAQKKINGSKIYIYDHGNSLRCNFYDYNHDFIISEKIISNLRVKKSNYLNLPELKFSVINNKYLKGNKISIIMYEGPKYSGRCISAPTSLTNYHSFKQLLNFYFKLKPSIKRKIQFKPPPYSKNRFDTYSRIKKIFGTQKVYDYKSNMIDVIDDSEFLICTYPQTTFLEILISKKPFLILIAKKHWMFDKFGEQLVIKLIKSKLLFTSEILAANHINKISKNINKWWNSKENQKNLLNLKMNYFNLNLNKDESWKKFLLK